MANVPRSLDRIAAWTWRLLVIAIGMVVVAFVVVQLRLVILPLVAAVVAAAVLDPGVRRLESMRWPHVGAVSTMLVGAIALVVLLGFLVIPRVPADLGELGQTVVQGIDRLEHWLVTGPLGLSEIEVARYRRTIGEQFGANASQIATGVLSGAALAVEFIAGLLLIVPILFFLLKDGRRFRDRFVDLFPPDERSRARAVLQRGWRAVGAYMRGLTIVAAFDAVFIGVGLLIIGVPLVFPLVVLTFIGAYFPIVGAFLSGLVAVLVALVTGGLFDALLVLAVVVAIQQLESHVLAPIVLGRAVNLHPLVILLTLTAGGVVAGVVGAFLAVPATAVAVAMLSEWRLQRREAAA